jgi:hypothetical protein
MIKEPRVGMKAKVLRLESAGVEIGDTVEIVETEIYGKGSKSVRAKDADGDSWRFLPTSLTEIKENDMYLDEALKAVREDENMELSWGARVAWYSFEGFIKRGFITEIQGFMKNDFAVRVKKQPIKEITPEQMMSDLEEKYGCKVKVGNK